MKGWENKMKADGKLKELEKFDRPKSVDEFLTEEKAKRMKRKAKQNAKMVGDSMKETF